MDPIESKGAHGEPVRKLTVRIPLELSRELHIRVAELDASLQDFVTASLEMVLRARVDPRR